MHRVAIFVAAVLLATPTAAWETNVRDSRGQRVVELYGFAEGSEVHGLVISCHPAAEGAFVGIGFAIPPTNDFTLAPGAEVVLQIGALNLDATFIQNDSDGAVAIVDGLDVSALDSVVGGAPSIDVRIDGLGAPLSIPSAHWHEAYSQFTQACGA